MEKRPELTMESKKTANERPGARFGGKAGRFAKPAAFRRGRLLLTLGTVAAFLPLCVFNGERYSVDSPSILLYGNWIHLSAFIDSYRYVGALIAQLYSFTGHDPIHNCLPDAILFILLAGIGTAMLVGCIADHLNVRGPLQLLALDLAVILAVENVWYCEILTFPESIFLSGVGLCLCYTAVAVFIRRRSVRGLAASAVCLILATAVYQQYIVVFTVFVIAVLACEILREERPEAKAAFVKYAGAAALILASGGVYWLLGKAIAKAFGIGGGSRIMPLSYAVLDNVRFYITHQHSFLKGRGYFKTEIMTASVLLLAAGWFLLFVLYARKKKQPVTAAVILLAFIMAYCASYLPGIVSKSHDTRVIFGLFSVFFLFTCGIVFMNPNKWVAASVSCVLAAMLAANVFAVVKMADNQKKRNRADLDDAEQIVRRIEEYEESSGVTVKNIFYCYDTNGEQTRSGSLFSEDFSMCAILSLRSRRYAPGVEEAVFALSGMPESVYREYFAEKNWDTLDLNEQLVIIGDSAYLCVY